MPRPYPFNESDGLELDPAYRELQRDESLSRVQLPFGGEAWLAVRHGDVRAVMEDPRFSRAAVVGREMPRVLPEVERNGASVMMMDPPDHSRLRKVLGRAFTGRRVEALRPRTAELTTTLLAGLRAAGPGSDFVAHFSMPLPLTVICELLGVPVGDRRIFRSASEAIMSRSEMAPQARLDAMGELGQYMARMVKQRRIVPTDDLLGALVLTRDEDDRLSEEELLELGITILVAGHETSMCSIGNMTYTLLTRPELWAALRKDPETVSRAVEELLRYIPLIASAGFPRVATQDVELSGATVRAGETVVVSLNAANRDPGVFTDADTPRLDRTPNRHIAFGHGPHHCPGSALARMELQEALRGLLREFRHLRLAVPPEDVQWQGASLVRGPRALPLTWDAPT